jgi:predicted RNase H-like nuclease (RuvC/YqgF family)
MDTEKEQEKNEKVDGEGEESDSLKRENEALARELKSRDATIIRLEENLAAKDEEIVALKKDLDELRQALDETGKAIPQAVAAYKEMVVQANPGLPAELITGDTIEAVKESVKNARAIMERVRQEMEAAAARTRIPAGAPQRAPLDLSALSAREKIQYAIRGSSA